MTALVAVCLTLTSPYVFKIAASFLVWLIHSIEGLAAEWKSADDFERAPSAPVARTLHEHPRLTSGKEQTYGTLKPATLSTADTGPSRATPNNTSGEQAPKHAQRVLSPQASPENDTGSLRSPKFGAATQRNMDPSQKSSLSPRNRDEDGSSTPDKSVSSIDSLSEQPKAIQSSASTANNETIGHYPGFGSDGETQSQCNDDAVYILQGASGSRETVWRYVKAIVRSSKRQIRSPSTTAIVITTVLFGLFVAHSVAGVFSAKIASDKSGLSSSKYCGIWEFDSNTGGEAAGRTDLKKKIHEEARAGQYARNCYGSPDPTSTES